MHGSRKYRPGTGVGGGGGGGLWWVGGCGGWGVQAHPPQVFLVINLIYDSFQRKLLFSKTPEGVPTFSGGGGGVQV